MTASVHIGCSGWAYDDWVGTFYRKGTPPREFLSAYARTFGCVEVDSTFYRIPSVEMTSRWYRATPASFRFAAKAPQELTHGRRLRQPEQEKLSCLLLQLPPSMTLSKDRAALEAILPQLRPNVAHAIEFRHISWFCDEIYELLRAHNVTLAWSENDVASTPPVRTSDLLYLRMIGDRELTTFDRIQRERGEDLQRWWAEVRQHLDLSTLVMIFFNNHFAGFGPAGGNAMRALAGQPPVIFPAAGGVGQRSLGGFG